MSRLTRLLLLINMSLALGYTLTFLPLYFSIPLALSWLLYVFFFF